MCIICSIYGIYSIDIAVTGMSEGGWDMSAPSKYIAVQTFSLFLGIAGFVLFTVIDADILGQQWKILCAINVLLLVALVIFGQDDGTGNKSWIRFAGIGIQPSEVIKVLYIVVAAKQMTYLKEYRDINSFLSVVQMAAHFGIVFLMIVGVSACLAGAVFGDHVSPISDTTIMASAGAQCNHLNHVSTQFPYAATVAVVAFVTYIIAGFIPNAVIVLPIGIVLMLATLFVIRGTVSRKSTEG